MREKKDFHSTFRDLPKETGKEKNGHPYPEIDEDESNYEWADEGEEETSLTDEIDHEILMHRDAHFAGDFKVMLDYYLSDQIGANPDFEIERIKYLAEVEHELDKNLAPLILTGAEAERVAKARQAYRQLKGLYEVEEEPATLYPRLIADLVLSEEEEPESAIEAVVAEGSSIVPLLSQIVQSEDAYDPLFPGYGYAPFLAILCLGKIKDPRAIIPIFETLSRETVFDEEIILESFAEIGEPAKKFLLKIITSRPLTRDNVNAAFALSAFPDDEEVAEVSLKQLKDSEVREKPLLSTYLLCHCDALKKSSLRQEFITLSKDPSLPKDLQQEMQKLIQDWQ